ncbi:MAG TPA: hypothetical protein ENN51_04895 [candidate division WOR-3 bacterium]|uniref:Uncharacterized protein n=1 Tax=candidate division WOR-3 bacterium TaxID=2052148 RepID=A0A7V0XFE3_UNCW3|nr:hypothetical protein [candidate division WOR-3 bacterium]
MDAILDRVKAVVGAGQKLSRLLVAYRRFIERPDRPVAAREKALAGVAAAAAGFPVTEVRIEVEQWLATERTRLAEAREELRFGFGGGLAVALSEMGLGITPRGQLPVVRVGLFSLRVDFDAGAATLYWGPEVEKLAAGIVLAPVSVAKAVRDELALLSKRAIAPARLSGLLHRAYRRWLSVGGHEPGSRAPLVELMAELALMSQPEAFRADPVRRRFVEYPRVQFSHDLYRLRAAATGEMPRLHVATFDSTTSRLKSLWVPDNDQGDGTHYSFVSYPVTGKPAAGLFAPTDREEESKPGTVEG